MICTYWYIFHVSLNSAPRYVYAMRPGRQMISLRVHIRIYSACTDEQRIWNMGTQRNLCPKRLMDITFSHHRAADARGNAQKCPSASHSFILHPGWSERGAQASSTACVKPSAQMSECCAGTGAWTSCVLATC